MLGGDERSSERSADLHSKHSRSRRWFGILSKRERWGLSAGGLVIVATLVIASLITLICAIHPFLAVTHRTESRVLVVEGWVHYFAIQAAVKEFKAGAYDRIFATGGPVSGNGGYTWDADTSASVTAGQLRMAGIRPEVLQTVPSRLLGRDRTYYSGLALRDWFHQHNLEVKKFNVVTESTHARRTWLLFQKAFGKETTVGIISVRNPDYDPNRWWRSSDGVREVLDEGIAYLYARLFFHPLAKDNGRTEGGNVGY